MPEEPKQIVIGWPDFWPEAQKEYQRFFEVAHKLAPALHSVVDREYPSLMGYQRVILNLSMLAGITMTEVITLAANGLGQGAMKCMRTLLETSINTEYLRLNPSEFDDYKEWFWVERFKYMDFMRKNSPETFKYFDSAVVEDAERNMDRVRPRFLRKDGKLRHTWCKHDLAERSVVTGHYDIYRMVNADASGFIHGSMHALMRYFDAEKDVDRIDIPPSLNWTAQALSTSHHCMGRIIETATKTFGVPSDPSIEEISKDFEWAWEAKAKKARSDNDDSNPRNEEFIRNEHPQQ